MTGKTYCILGGGGAFAITLAHYLLDVGKPVDGITDEVVHWIAPAPTVSQFCRMKLTGQGSNAASTQLTKLKLHYTAKA